MSNDDTTTPARKGDASPSAQEADRSKDVMGSDEDQRREEEEQENEEEEEDEDEDEDEEDEDGGEPVEMLVTGRERRATAGNRMSSLVEREGDDDLDLLFAEDGEEEDAEFEGDDDHASDAEMDSSSDGEDQGPTHGEEELVGEQELQQQEKAERRKRKAADVFKKPAALRKRVKINNAATVIPEVTGTESAVRPKKKAERASFGAAIRTSSRKQTVKNREVVHKRWVDNEKQRAKVMRQMEEAQRRKDANKVKPLTQAERLEEAAKIERKNAKSLNRWEEAEKKRAEEQRAKLEALHNRQLSGPVVTWWSGIARWASDKVAEVGVRSIRQAGHKEESTASVPDSDLKTEVSQGEVAVAAEVTDQAPPPPPPPPPQEPGPDSVMESIETQPTLPSPPPPDLTSPPAPSEQAEPAKETPPGPAGSLDGIHAHAAPQSDVSQPGVTNTAQIDIKTEGPAPLSTSHDTSAPLPTAPPVAHDSEAQAQAPANPPPPPPSRLPEYTSRNLMALKNIDGNTTRLPEILQKAVSNASGTLRKKGPKPPKVPKAGKQASSSKTAVCVITGSPAKFKDPATGLPYANAYAYAQIRRLQQGGARWSNLLECYVGASQSVARGVPERFWQTSKTTT